MAYSIHTPQILEFLGYVVLDDFEWNGTDLTWFHTDPKPTDAEVLAQEKPWAASVTKEKIYREQEIRSANIDMLSGDKLGFEMPRTVIDILEETYTKILVPAARQAITEAAPFWWDIKELRNNRNTLLTNLQVWVDDPTKTAQDILDFDVENWVGWSVARP